MRQARGTRAARRARDGRCAPRVDDERERGQRVQRVVPADERQRVGRHRAVRRRAQATSCRGSRTRPHSPSSDGGPPPPNVSTVRPGMRIASERGSSRFRTCTPPPREDARLRRGVVVDARVAVEMVLGDVEHRRGDRRQAIASFRAGSSTARARTRRATVARRFERRDTSSTASPMLPATTRVEPGCAAQRTGQCGHRRLAVGPGDRQHLLRGRQRAGEELDVADDRRRRALRPRQSPACAAHAGTDCDQVRARHRRSP